MPVSQEIMNSGKFGPCKPSPATPGEATTNYQKLFEQSSQCLDGLKEPVFMKTCATNTILAHNYDVWFNPRQMILDPNLYPGRMNSTLDFVNSSKDYTDDRTGTPKPTSTCVDGNESDYNGSNLFTRYPPFPIGKPYQALAGHDARSGAMVLFPGQNFGSTKIIIQGGLVKADGFGYRHRTQVPEKGQDSLIYYTYGAGKSTEYSGFDPTLGHYTRNGFLFEKFLQIESPVEQAWSRGTQPWVDFRYGEILLNYAEAVIEKTTSISAEKQAVQDASNAIRKRAAHKGDIALTQANVCKERFVELAFENKHRWDLLRQRTFYKEFENRVREGPVPFLDLRISPAHYVFVRVNPLGAESKTFDYSWYYKSIPDTGANDPVQNP